MNLLFFWFQEVEALRQEKLEIDQQLRSMHGSTTGPLPNFPPVRRGMPSGPEESGGGGRGGRGGGGRGGRGGRGRAPPRHNAGKYRNFNSHPILTYKKFIVYILHLHFSAIQKS